MELLKAVKWICYPSFKMKSEKFVNLKDLIF